MRGVTVEELEAFRDVRGWAAHPIDYARLRAGGLENIHIVSMAPGTLRGNHYHPKQTEDVTVIGGPMRIVFRDTDGGAMEEITVEPDQLLRIRFAPGIAHVFQNTGDGVAYLVCSSDHLFNPENPDTVREELIAQG